MILVTGASGLVGREVAARLRHAPVRLALHDPAQASTSGVRFDFSDPSSFGAALDGVERVFLLRPPQLARARHDFGPFIAAMVKAGVRQVVFLSVRGAGGNPLLPHRQIEKLLEASPLAWTHLRPNDFMQNFATVHRDDIRGPGEIWAPAGRGCTSFVDVRDVADAAARVLTGAGHERQAYTLTGPKALSLGDVASVLSEVLDRRITYRNPGIPTFLRHNRAARRPLMLGLVMAGVYTAARLGLAAAVTPDLQSLTGQPPTPFRAFARDHASVWQRA